MKEVPLPSNETAESAETRALLLHFNRFHQQRAAGDPRRQSAPQIRLRGRRGDSTTETERETDSNSRRGIREEKHFTFY